MRILITLLFIVCVSGCTRPEPDMSPIGGGLAVIGLSIIVSTVVVLVCGKGGLDDE